MGEDAEAGGAEPKGCGPCKAKDDTPLADDQRKCRDILFFLAFIRASALQYSIRPFPATATFFSQIDAMIEKNYVPQIVSESLPHPTSLSFLGRWIRHCGAWFQARLTADAHFRA